MEHHLAENSHPMYCNRKHVHVRFMRIDDTSGPGDLPNLDNMEMQVRSSAGVGFVPYRSAGCDKYGWCWPAVIAKHENQHVEPPARDASRMDGMMKNYPSTLGHTPYWKYERLPFWYMIDPYPTPMDLMRWRWTVSRSFFLQLDGESSQEWTGAFFPYFRPTVRKMFGVGFRSSLYSSSKNMFDVRSLAPDDRRLNKFPGPADGYGAFAQYVQFGSFSNDTGTYEMNLLAQNKYCDNGKYAECHEATDSERGNLELCKQRCLNEGSCRYLVFSGSARCCARYIAFSSDRHILLHDPHRSTPHPILPDPCTCSSLYIQSCPHAQSHRHPSWICIAICIAIKTSKSGGHLVGGCPRGDQLASSLEAINPSWLFRYDDAFCLTKNLNNHDVYRREVGQYPGSQFMTDGTAVTGWRNSSDVPEARVTRLTNHTVTDMNMLYQIQQSLNPNGMLTRDWRDVDDPKILYQQYLSTFVSYTRVINGVAQTVQALGRDDFDMGRIPVPTNLTFSYSTTDFQYQQFIANL